VAFAGSGLTTSFQSIFDPGDRVVGLIVYHNCDQTIVLSLDGVTDWLTLLPQSAFTLTYPIVIPFGAMGVDVTGPIYAREAGINVTSGSIYLTAIRGE
jgi:hypothetical protein